MQFLSALLGDGETSLLNAAFALGIVLLLVLLALWAVKFVLGLSNATPISRGRRLAVIESVQLDARHKVSIIRRDEVEYVVLTGGAQDLLLESGIPADLASRRAQRRGPVGTGATQPQAAHYDSTLAPDAVQAPPDSSAGSSPRHPHRVQTAGLPRSTALRRSHVIPIPTHIDPASPDDSATSEPDTPTNGQAKLGAATTSRFPGSTFNFEGR